MSDDKTMFLARLSRVTGSQSHPPGKPKSKGVKKTGLAEIMRDAYPYIDILRNDGHAWYEIIIKLLATGIPIEHPEKLTKAILCKEFLREKTRRERLSGLTSAAPKAQKMDEGFPHVVAKVAETGGAVEVKVSVSEVAPPVGGIAAIAPEAGVVPKKKGRPYVPAPKVRSEYHSIQPAFTDEEMRADIIKSKWTKIDDFLYYGETYPVLKGPPARWDGQARVRGTGEQRFENDPEDYKPTE